jgi:hypothetical protein
MTVLNESTEACKYNKHRVDPFRTITINDGEDPFVVLTNDLREDSFSSLNK